MKKRNYKYKSGFNISYFLLSLFVLYIFHFIILSLVNSELGELLITIVAAVLSYLALSYLVNRYYIYEDRFEIIYFFRLFNRITIIKFNEISSVKYIHDVNRYSAPTIQLISEKVKWKVDLPNNSFPVYSFEKRRAILLFIASTGIPVEIYSEFEKDITILHK
jgi:hypothetical protein